MGLQYHSALSTVLYCTVLYCTVLYCTVLYCNVLYCIILYCIVLYCTVLYGTELYRFRAISKFHDVWLLTQFLFLLLLLLCGWTYIHCVGDIHTMCGGTYIHCVSGYTYTVWGDINTLCGGTYIHCVGDIHTLCGGIYCIPYNIVFLRTKVQHLVDIPYTFI